VAISGDNRLIVSGGRDKTVRAWNALARQCFSSEKAENGHGDWVSGITVSAPLFQHLPPTIISGSWDGTVKVGQHTFPIILQLMNFRYISFNKFEFVPFCV